jgi:Arc/MetJ-type ribon-helix-helix transcriptional regulator
LLITPKGFTVRTSKIIAISVPPKFEQEIQKHAQYEHRTISEYVREAVRKYMSFQEFEEASKRVSKRLKKKGLGPADVEKIIDEMRKKA